MQVYLIDEEKYEEFEPINEMIVNRSGAKLDPEPKFMISGLVSDEEYIMKLRIELADEFRYKFRKNSWIPVAGSTKNASLSRRTQAETSKEYGATWHKRVVQFEKIRITREFNEKRQNMAYVEPGHKYIPILTIFNVSTGISIDYRFDLLVFIAVKSYQSIPVRHAKRRNQLNCPLISLNSFEENEKPVNLLSLELSPKESQQMTSFYPTYSNGFPNGIGETSVPYPHNSYPFDYFLLYPQVQYPLNQQLLYSIPTSSIHYSHIEDQIVHRSIQDNRIVVEELIEDIYIPVFGWNSVLIPGCKREQIKENVYNILGFHHEIWSPQEMELENLYFQTEQNYHPLEME